MKTTAFPVSRPQFPSWSGLTARALDFIALMKPRVMVLAVFTAVVGLFIAPGDVDPLLGAVSIIGIAAGAGGAGVLNMWYDADIDAVMTRTARRPIPDGRSLAARSAWVRTRPRVRRNQRSRPGAQRRSRGTACPHDLRLHRGVYDLAEASDTSEHSHRWHSRRSSAGDWLGGGYRSHRDRAVDPVPDHLPVDPTALLGAVAHSHRRIRSCGRAYAAHCWRERHNSMAYPRL